MCHLCHYGVHGGRVAVDALSVPAARVLQRGGAFDLRRRHARRFPPSPTQAREGSVCGSAVGRRDLSCASCKRVPPTYDAVRRPQCFGDADQLVPKPLDVVWAVCDHDLGLAEDALDGCLERSTRELFLGGICAGGRWWWSSERAGVFGGGGWVTTASAARHGDHGRFYHPRETALLRRRATPRAPSLPYRRTRSACRCRGSHRLGRGRRARPRAVWQRARPRAGFCRCVRGAPFPARAAAPLP